MRKTILIASVLISLGAYAKVQRDIKKNPKKDYKLTKYAYCRDIK